MSGAVEAGVYVVAATMVLVSAAHALQIARSRQAAALTAERRASEIKNEFVAMITHELRTPLTTITGFATTLADAWSRLEPEEVDEFLALIIGESQHLKNLVDDVLAIPRLEAGRLTLEVADFAVGPCAFKVANLLFPPGGPKEASVSVAGNVIVHADPNRVEQVLRNLLENARKYGGDRVSVEALPSDDAWVLVVADNGQGIPEGAWDRIFERFEQVTTGDSRTDSGFGLGLAITRRLVEAMGGRVWYEPGFPVGARFCFTLPIARDQHQPIGSPLASEPA